MNDLDMQVELGDDVYDVGSNTAKAVYEALVVQSPRRSRRDFYDLVCGFSISICSITGTNMARTYPGRFDAGAERCKLMIDIGEQLAKTGREMLAESAAAGGVH